MADSGARLNDAALWHGGKHRTADARSMMQETMVTSQVIQEGFERKTTAESNKIQLSQA